MISLIYPLTRTGQWQITRLRFGISQNNRKDVNWSGRKVEDFLSPENSEF